MRRGQARTSVIDLLEAASHPRECVGGKAWFLSRAARLHPEVVPRGFVVTSGALDAEAASALASAYASLGRASGEARPPVAVRSSASVEDDAASSCSGLFETRLDVRGREALLEAIADVRHSSQSPAATRYLDVLGIPSGTVRMSALVMPMIAARVAGVAFSRDPVGAQPLVTMELVPGLGARLMDGGGAAQRIVMSSGTSQLVSKDDLAGGDLISVAERERLARLVDGLHDELAGEGGVGVDVEFAFDAAGRLWLLQVRPFQGPRVVNRTLPAPVGVRSFHFPNALTPCPGRAEGPLVFLSGRRAKLPAQERAVLAVDCVSKGLFMTGDIGRAAGVLARQGSLLDHGANLLRELGIPALVGLGDGLDELARHDGEAVHLDARARTLFLREHAESSEPILVAARRDSTKDDQLLSSGDRMLADADGAWLGRPAFPQCQLQLSLRGEAYRRVSAFVGFPVAVKASRSKGFYVLLRDLERIRDWLADCDDDEFDVFRVRRRVGVTEILRRVEAPEPLEGGEFLDAYIDLLAWAQIGGLVCDQSAKRLENHLRAQGVPMDYSAALLAGRYTSELRLRSSAYEELLLQVRRAGAHRLAFHPLLAPLLLRRHRELRSRIHAYAAHFRHAPPDLRRGPPVCVVRRAIRHDLRGERSDTPDPASHAPEHSVRDEVRRLLGDEGWRSMDARLDAAAWEAYIADSDQEIIARMESRLREVLRGVARREGTRLRRLLALNLEGLRPLLRSALPGS